MGNNLRLVDSPVTCVERVKKQVKKRLPILQWLPNYRRDQVVSDMISGIAVGLTVVPQSMAYASISGLTPEFGLYSSYVGCFLYVILGSCRQVTIGPTAIMGLLTFETCGADFSSCVILTGFYAGVFELFMAFLHLGWLVSFISEPVVIGFTCGAATTIISSQIKNFLGLLGPTGNGFWGYWISILQNIGTISVADSAMGICSFIALLILKELKDLKFFSGAETEGQSRKLLRKLCWLISISRNVIIVIITALIAYLWPGIAPFKLTGKVIGGFPPVGLPTFNLPYNSSTADDPDTYRTFLETWSLLGAGPLVIALISVLQNVAISKAFGSGQKVDATQEMFALGMSSIVGSFFSAIPISGSFSRSAVNESSGVQSQLGGLFTGLLVLLSLGFLTPSFYYIPKASLASVIIAAVMTMIELKSLGIMWRISRMDLMACLITFLASILLGMEYGILVGVGISLCALLLESLKPDLQEEMKTDPVSGINYIYMQPESGIKFPSVDHIRSRVTKLAGKSTDASVIVINFRKWTKCDYTAVTGLASLIKCVKKEGKDLIFVDCGRNWISAFENAGYHNIPHFTFFELSAHLSSRPTTEDDIRNVPSSSTNSAQEASPLKPTKSSSCNIIPNDSDYGAVTVQVDASEVNGDSLKPLL